jgi:hypothetical protein
VGIWDSIWRSEAESWIFGRVDSQEGLSSPLRPNCVYVSVMLRSMRIVNSRVGFSRLYGTVQSYARLAHLYEGVVEFTAVTTPSHLRNVEKRDLNNFVIGDRRLLGPAPYRGGDLELEIGLFAIKSQDMLGPFLTLLESLSQAAGVGIFSVASPYIMPLRMGVELLTRPEGTASLEIGLSTTFTAPAVGKYFVVRLPRKDYDPFSFSVDEGNRLINKHGEHVANAPYLVFSIEAESVRPDWFAIPDIRNAYERLSRVVRENVSFRIIDSHKEYLFRTLYASPDILSQHAEQISSEVSKQLAVTLQSIKTAKTGEGPALPPLESFELSPVNLSFCAV